MGNRPITSLVQSDTPPTGEQAIQHLKTMPLLLTIVTLLYFVAAPIAALHNVPFGDNTGQFMVKQLVLNSSLLIVLSMLYGILSMAYPNSAMSKFQNVFLPTLLIFALWTKSYVTYRSGLTNHCSALAKQNSGMYSPGSTTYVSSALLWNTSKVPIAIFAVYLFVILFPQTMSPFFQFFSGDEEPHPLIMYFAIGFWTGCAAWASEASCYFQLMRNGCRPYDNIQFETIAQVEESG